MEVNNKNKKNKVLTATGCLAATSLAIYLIGSLFTGKNKVEKDTFQPENASYVVPSDFVLTQDEEGNYVGEKRILNENGEVETIRISAIDTIRFDPAEQENIQQSGDHFVVPTGFVLTQDEEGNFVGERRIRNENGEIEIIRVSPTIVSSDFLNLSDEQWRMLRYVMERENAGIKWSDEETKFGDSSIKKENEHTLRLRKF